MAMTITRPGLRQEIEDFLYKEALLLDTYRVREWFNMLTDDIRYRVPTLETRFGTTDRFASDSLYFDYVNWDRRLIDVRVRQLETDLNHCEIPPSVTQRMVSNVYVEPVEHDDEVLAYSNLQITQFRHGTHETRWVARREDRLRKIDAEWKLADRRVILLGSALPRTLGLFL
jgi:3-phenylpropionate/cinnamic acid dioxygenase small subunit